MYIIAGVIALVCVLVGIWYCYSRMRAHHDAHVRELILVSLRDNPRWMATNGDEVLAAVRELARALRPQLHIHTPWFMDVVTQMSKDDLLTVTRSNECPRDVEFDDKPYISPRWVVLMLTNKGSAAASDLPKPRS